MIYWAFNRRCSITHLATYEASWTRDYETVYRYGAKIYHYCQKRLNDEEACRAGVRICQLVDKHAITHSEGHINITVTAGVSRAFPEDLSGCGHWKSRPGNV